VYYETFIGGGKHWSLTLGAGTCLRIVDRNGGLAMRTGELVPVARASKRAVADRIFDEILKLRLSLYAIHNER